VRYVLEDIDTGERFEIELPVDQAPEGVVEIEGRKLRQVLAMPQVSVPRYDNGGETYADGSPMGDRGLGRGWPFAEHYDKKNRPLFANKAERAEAHARAQAAGDLLTSADLSQPGNPEDGRMFLDR